jgi:uncharacterized metal-binding protein
VQASTLSVFLCVMAANSMWMCSDIAIRLDKTGHIELWDCVIVAAGLGAKQLIPQTVITQAPLTSYVRRH